jgi:HEAT repeat protein
VAVLEKGIHDESAAVRQAAVGALGAQRSAKAVPALEGALKDENITVRRHAARSLQNLTGRDYSDRVAPPR